VGIPRKVSDLGGLSRAERQVLAELDTGEFIVLGDGKVPETGDESREVRAGLIRLLLLGSDPKHQPHEKGVLILGAWIPDALDLEGCRIPRDIALMRSRFDATPELQSACIGSLFLNGGVVPGLSADRLEAKGDVFLRDRFKATGAVRLPGAKLGGDLDCVGATFRAEKDAAGKPGNALVADGLEAKGDVFLRDGFKATGAVRLPGAKLGGDFDCTRATFRAEKDAQGNPGNALVADRLEATGGVVLRGVEATGAVRLLGAKLGGNLDCVGATFWAEKDAQGDPGNALVADRLETKGNVDLRGVKATGEVRLPGAKLGGDFDCTRATFRAEKDAQGNPGNALVADGAKVEGALFLRGDAKVLGPASLAGAEVGSLNDDPECWPGRGYLILDRFRYGAIVGGPVDADARIEWLGRQDPARWGKDFWPQPYEHCAKVLREMGHGGEARKVLIKKERLQRAARRDGFNAQLKGARLRMRIERSGAQSVWPDVVATIGSFRDGDPRKSALMLELRKSPQVRALLAGDKSSASDVPEGASDRIMAARAPIWDYRWRLTWARIWDGLVGATIGYGRAPQRAALWALGFLLVGWFVFAVAGGNGAIKPNNAFMLRQAAWTDCAPEDRRARLACFEAAAPSYPTFNAFIYSADTLLPIVSLEMQEYWIPDDDTGRGAWARVYLWVHIGVGWALSLLAVAGFSGLVKSD